MKMPENLDCVELRLRAKAGAEISRCLREALALAVAENVPAAVEHNGRWYRFCPNGIIDAAFILGQKGKEEKAC